MHDEESERKAPVSKAPPDETQADDAPSDGELSNRAVEQLDAIDAELDELAALEDADRFADWQRHRWGRSKPPGANERERQRYLLAQQRLRQFARLGITLEVDADGAPMPWATGTGMRQRSDPFTLPSSMPTLKVRDPRTLGRTLWLWRRRLNAPPKVVAERAGQTPRFLNDLERGKPGAALSRVLAVVDALGMELLIRPKRPRR